MKTLKYLLMGAVATAFLCACSDEEKIEPEPTPEPEPEVQDTDHPAPASVTLGGYGESALRLVWSAVESAASYTAQLLDMEEAVGYEEITGETAYEFADLEAGSLWYGRVRSDFDDGEHSDWVYVTYSGSTEHAVLVPGQGAVELHPTIELLRSTNSTLTYGWSFTGSNATDESSACEICLYSDEACSNLVVGWTIGAGSGIFNSDAGCRFVFSGLEPSTTYYCKVVSITYSGFSTDVLAGTTLASGPSVTATAAGSAAAGDVLVSEDFSKVYHGGQLSDFAAAYYITSSYRSENIKAEGMDDSRCTLAPFNTSEFDVFDGGGVTSGYTEGTGLADWAHTSGTAAGRSGHLKLGAGDAPGGIWTPVLSALPEGDSNVSVSFSAKNYITGFNGTGADTGHMIVSAVSGASVTDAGVASGGETLSSSSEIDITDTADGFKTFSVSLKNVTPTCRIRIETTALRAFIDDIVVTYLGVSNNDPLAVPQNVAFDEASSMSSLTLTWDNVEFASSYTVKYWKDGDDANAKEVSGITATAYTIEDLEKDTTYWAQVKACDPDPDLDSDYCDAVSGTTLDATGVNITFTYAGTSSITIKWDVNGGTVEQTAFYPVEVGLYTSSDCVDETLFVSWLIKDTTIWVPTENHPYVGFTFSSLSPNTPYYAMVSVIGDDSLVSEPVRIVTESLGYSVTATAEGSAGVGDILVAEDFSGVVHGGDIAFKAAGVTTSNKKWRDEMRLPRGKNPVTYLKPIDWNTTFNIFTNDAVTDAYTEATGLADWCIGDDTSLGTMPGYVKVGGSGEWGYIATPELTAIPEGKTATVRVDFTALPYYHNNSSDSDSIIVGAIDNVQMCSSTDGEGTRKYEAEGWKGSSDEADFKDFTTVEIIHGENINNTPFDDYSVTLQNVTNKSRIRFSANTLNPSSKKRFMLNSVVVTVTDLK